MLTEPQPHGWMAASADFLRRCDSDRIAPAEALRAAAQLQDQVAPATLDLTWQGSLSSSDLQYDLHVREAAGTFSLSYCGDDGVPWVLRQAQPWADQHVVRVNGELVDIETVFSKLDFVWGDTGMLTRLVDDTIISQAIQRLGLTLGVDEAQQALQTFLARRNLDDPSALASWMAARGLSDGKLRQHAESLAMVSQLKRHVVSGQERAYFEDHREAFERWSLLVLSGGTPLDRQKVESELLATGPQAWLERAVASVPLALPAGIEVRLCRALRRDAETSRNRFEEHQGTWLRRVARVSGTSDASFLLERSEARYDEAIAESCREAIFRDWLASERRQAQVEWFWGPAS